MARIRSVKPEFWLDRKLARKLSRDERMLYMALWNQADEHARALGDPVVVKGATFPYDDDLTVDIIDRMLNRLDVADVVHRYEVDGDPYLFLPKLASHQRLEPHKSQSRHPEPPPRVVAAEDSEVFSDESARNLGGAAIFSESGHGSVTFGVDQQKQAIPRTATIFSDESAQDPRKKSLLYGAWSMEQGGRFSDESAQTDPPVSNCPRHPEGTSEPCSACRDARKRRQQFEIERPRLRAAAQSEDARRAAETRFQAIANCQVCDSQGYFGTVVCSHDPDEAIRAQQGMAKVRAALTKPKVTE